MLRRRGDDGYWRARDCACLSSLKSAFASLWNSSCVRVPGRTPMRPDPWVKCSSTGATRLYSGAGAGVAGASLRSNRATASAGTIAAGAGDGIDAGAVATEGGPAAAAEAAGAGEPAAAAETADAGATAAAGGTALAGATTAAGEKASAGCSLIADGATDSGACAEASSRSACSCKDASRAAMRSVS